MENENENENQNENQNQNENENNGADNQEIQLQSEIDKIGHFNVESWRQIFKHLSVWDLANVSLVCKGFQTIARDVFAPKNKKKFLLIKTKDFGWKTIISRFRNEITELQVEVFPGKDERLFQYFTILHKTLEALTFKFVNVNQFKNILTLRKFHKLHTLSFLLSDISEDCGILNKLARWCPQLKALKFSYATVGQSNFLEQSVPTLEEVSFHGIQYITNEKFIIFIVKNRQLKKLYVEMHDIPSDVIMECLPIVNELLPNLESMRWDCDNMDELPSNFRHNFANLKDLSFNLCNKETYTSQLMKIVKFLPRIEDLRIIDCKENLMTNDDLLELLIGTSSTLMKLAFKARGRKQELRFGYDFHRQICSATSNRSSIFIEIEFGYYLYSKPTKLFVITQDWIKENENLIVLRGLLN